VRAVFRFNLVLIFSVITVAAIGLHGLWRHGGPRTRWLLVFPFCLLMALEQINSFDNRLSQQQTIAPLLALPPAPTTCRSFVLLPTITNPSIPRFTYQNEAVILAQRNALWPGLCAVDPDHRTWAALTRTDLIRQAGLTLSPGTRLGFTLADDSGHRFRKPGPGWGTPDVGGTWRHNTDSQGSGIDTRLFWRIQTRLFESKPAFTGFRGHGAGHADAGRAHPRPLESTHWGFASTRTRGRRRGPRTGDVSVSGLASMIHCPAGSMKSPCDSLGTAANIHTL